MDLTSSAHWYHAFLMSSLGYIKPYGLKPTLSERQLVSRTKRTSLGSW